MRNLDPVQSSEDIRNILVHPGLPSSALPVAPAGPYDNPQLDWARPIRLHSGEGPSILNLFLRARIYPMLSLFPGLQHVAVNL